MKAKILILILFALRSAFAGYTVKDSLGTDIILESTPWRVVTMTPALAEIASEVGLQDTNIVGVSEYTNYPVTLKSKPSIGPYTKPNVEKIVSLKPDLILASEDGTPRELIERLRKLKIPVMILRTDGIQSTEAALTLLSRALGQEYQGKLAIEKIRKKMDPIRLRELKREKKSVKKISVLIQVGEDPLIVAGSSNFLSEGLSLLGVKNIYSDLKAAYPRVSVEDVVTRNPDVIILLALGTDSTTFEKARTRWMVHSEMKAVKDDKIFILRSDALVRPGPRFSDGLIEMEKVLFNIESNK